MAHGSRLEKAGSFVGCGDESNLLVISGNGDLIEPDDGVAAVGSGGPIALAAAKALIRHTDLECGEIAREALQLPPLFAYIQMGRSCVRRYERGLTRGVA